MGGVGHGQGKRATLRGPHTRPAGVVMRFECNHNSFMSMTTQLSCGVRGISGAECGLIALLCLALLLDAERDVKRQPEGGLAVFVGLVFQILRTWLRN
jgi:hypothetical protein